MLQIQGISDFSGTALQIVLLIVAVILGFAYMSYHRWPAEGRPLGEIEFSVYGNANQAGYRFGGNTVAITDWIKDQWIKDLKQGSEHLSRHIDNVGGIVEGGSLVVQVVPEMVCDEFIHLLQREDLFLYAIRSESS